MSSDFSERYLENGIKFPVEILSQEEAVTYRSKLEAMEAQVGGPMALVDNGINNKKVHLLFAWANELARHPKILDEVEKVIGPNILCWGSEFFTKEANSKNYVAWHQDATYWGFGEDDVVTVWLALSPSNEASGCMRVVPGSHKKAVEHEKKGSEGNMLSRGQEIAVDVDEDEAVNVELKPGEASLHHVLIFHGSKPNLSDDRRIGYVIRYLPTHIKPQGGEDSATLVRGTDAFGNFEKEPVPKGDFEPSMVEHHRRLVGRMEARQGQKS